MSAKDIQEHNHDNHIIDYMEFHDEQMNWFEESDKRQLYDTRKWIADFLYDFPVHIDYTEPPL